MPCVLNVNKAVYGQVSVVSQNDSVHANAKQQQKIKHVINVYIDIKFPLPKEMFVMARHCKYRQIFNAGHIGENENIFRE